MSGERATTDSSAARFALLSATTMIAHQVAGKATRDGLFLTHFDVAQLPKVVIASAIASIAGVLAMSWLLARYGPARLVPRMFVLSAALFVCEWILAGTQPAPAAVVLYLHMGTFGALLISGFWSVVNERFDPHSAKATIANVAAAATLGGLVGGFIAESVADIDVRAMLLVLAAMHAACAWSVGRVGSGTSTRAAAGAGLQVRSGLRVLAGSHYLLTMGGVMVLIAVVAALLDYALKAQAAASFAKGRELVGFFATFYAVVGVLTFGVQSLFGERALRRFGLSGTMAMLPLAVIGAGTVGLFVPKLLTIGILRAAEAVFANSFFRAGFELLYTPVAPAEKRPTKTIIDVASNRVGDLIGGGLLLALVWALPEPPPGIVIIVAIAFAAAALFVVYHLHTGYVAQLASSLRTGTVTPEAVEAVDSTTRAILAEWSPLAERELLRSRIARRRETVVRDGVPGDEVPRAPAPGWKAALVADLTSGDAARLRRALHSEHLDRSLTPWLIELLGNPVLADDARLELRWLVPRIVGQITDALVDPDTPTVVRQRLPSVIEVHHNPRAVEALMLGLEDPAFHVRYGCARALGRMLARARDLSVDPERVFAAVLREVDVDGDTWARQGELTPHDFDEALAVSAGQMDLSLQHVFALLGLVLDPVALNLAMHALASRDRTLRGTALEYLENVLPPDVRRGLWRHIGVQDGAPQSGRSSREILRDLERVGGAGDQRPRDH